MVDPKPKKKSGAHFNVMDFLIILILVLCILSIAARYSLIWNRIGISQNLEDYEISFTVSNLRYTTPSFLKIRDTVYLKDSDTEMGYLLSREEGSVDALTLTLSSRYVQSENGFISAYYEENSFVDASGRMMCRGRIDEDGYFYLDGDICLAAGQTLAVYTELVDFELTITGIRLSSVGESS